MLKQRFSNIFGTAKKRGAAVFAAMGMAVIVSAFFVGFNFAQTSPDISASGITAQDAKAKAAMNSALRALGGAGKIGGIDSLIIKGKVLRATFGKWAENPDVMVKTGTFTYDTEIRILLPDNFIQINVYPAGNKGPHNLFPPSRVSTTAYEGVSHGRSLSTTLLPTKVIVNREFQPADSTVESKCRADDAIAQINLLARFMIGMLAKSGPAPLSISAGSAPGVFAIAKTGEDFGEIEFDPKTGYPSVVRFKTPAFTLPNLLVSNDPETGEEIFSTVLFDSGKPSPMVDAEIIFKDRFSVDGVMFPRVIHWLTPDQRDMELWIQEVQINPNLTLQDFDVPE